jgi:hypothetical protein
MNTDFPVVITYIVKIKRDIIVKKKKKKLAVNNFVSAKLEFKSRIDVSDATRGSVSGL